MSEPWKWTEADLLRLVADRAAESIGLEFKRSESLDKTDDRKNELSKDVSAFANSAGGTLVYGMTENGNVATGLDGGFDPTVTSKEWLEQVIGSRIQRRIDGLRINPVELVTHAPGKVAYVVSVPQSQRAPHQAADKKFYKRFNFQSVPMEEYEIRDVARRQETPDLDVRFRFDGGVSATLPRNPVESPANVLRLHAALTNRSASPAEYAVIEVLVDGRIRIETIPDRGSPPTQTVEIGGHTRAVHVVRYDWNGRDRMPLFDGVDFPLTQPVLRVSFPEIPTGARFLLAVRLHTPRANLKQLVNWFQCDQWSVSIVPHADPA